MAVVEYTDYAGRGMVIQSGNFTVWSYNSSLIEDPNWTADTYDADTFLVTGSFNNGEWWAGIYVDYYGGSYAYFTSAFMYDADLNSAVIIYNLNIQFDLNGDYSDGATFTSMYSGNDQFYGNSYTDYIECGLGNDVAYGNSGNDTILGQNGNDTLYGGNNNDRLYGGDNNDTLYGGTGNDTLQGDAGKDSLTGGSGADKFIFRSVSESATGGTTADVITDFVRGSDKIDLSAIDAFAGTGTNDAFVWRGTGQFTSATKGEVRYQKFDNYGTTNDYTMVWIDNDADTGVEMSIRLTGLYNLTASDFIL